MKTKASPIALLAALAFIGNASNSFGRNEHLSFSQSHDGSVLVTLTGQLFYCDFQLGGFVGLPTFTISGNQINVVSIIVAVECPPPPPGFVFPPPQPYAITVNIGHLPDGTFDVSWSFAGTGVLHQTFSSSFTLAAGNLPAPVPVLAPAFSAILLLTLAAIGVAAVYRSPGA